MTSYRTSSSISIVIPALNEEKTLEKTVNWTLDELKKLSDIYEIVIVNDGSTDSTFNIAEQLSKKSPFIRVINNPFPTGYGGALNKGFLCAKHEILGIITADCEFWPSDIKRFIEELDAKKVDIVTSMVPYRPLPFYRKILSKGWRLSMRVILGETPKLEGIFFIRKKIFSALIISSRSGMWAMELLIRARRHGAKFSTITMEVHPRENMGESKVVNIATILLHLKEILDLKKALEK